MPRRKRRSYEIDDCFAVRLADFSYSVGQIVGREPNAMNSVLCAFFAHQVAELPDEPCRFDLVDKMIALLFVTPDYLDSGEWPIIGKGKSIAPDRYIALRQQRRRGFVGTTIIGSGIAKTLMDAYYRLYPWNGFAIPDYLDGLLLSPDLKPKDALYR